MPDRRRHASSWWSTRPALVGLGLVVSLVVAGVSLIQWDRPPTARWVAGPELSSTGPAVPGSGPAGGSPSPSTATLSTDADGHRVLRLLGAGDVLVHPEVAAQARADARRAGGSGLDFAPMFAGVRPAISGADLALCHLETPLAEPAGPFSGYPTFNAPPQVLAGVRAAGFDGCSTASNHTLDQGVAGVVRTIRAFDAAGLGHTGSAASSAAAATTKVYRVGGVRVAHLAYSFNFNGLSPPPDKPWLANLIEPAKILAAARRARAEGADIVVLSLHWGTEYEHLPNASQEAWARQLTASPDIDLILGHHAHVVQPIQQVNGKWVVFGMGNELARHADPIDDNREGVMARITFTEVGPRHWTATRVEALPTWVDLSPDIRLVDLGAALADPALPAADRDVYRAAYRRVAGYVQAGGGASTVVAPPPGG